MSKKQEDWKASATIRLSIHGYEVNYTLRQYAEDDPPEDSRVGSVLLKRVGNFIEGSKRAGYLPIYGKNAKAQAKPEPTPKAEEEHPEKKPCPLHPGHDLERRQSKRGGYFYSHTVKMADGSDAKDADGKTIWCHGKK